MNPITKMKVIETELERLEIEIGKHKKALKRVKALEERYAYLNSTESKIFELYYIRGLHPNTVAKLVPCGRSTVYRCLQEIEKKLNMKGGG